MPIRWNRWLYVWWGDMSQSPKSQYYVHSWRRHHSRTWRYHKGIFRPLQGSTLRYNADVDMIVARMRRICDTILLWPYSYASEVPAIENALSTFGSLTSASFYIWDSILAQKKSGSKQPWLGEVLFQSVHSPHCLSPHPLLILLGVSCLF